MAGFLHDGARAIGSIQAQGARRKQQGRPSGGGRTPQQARPSSPKPTAQQPRQATQPTQAARAPQAAPYSGGGGGSYGGGGGGSAPISGMMAPMAAPPISEEDYLAGDATYNATISALAKQFANFQADINGQRDRYNLDFDKGVKDLGYIDPDANVTGDETWNWDDQLTASGRGYQNQLNDFASRNMLQSQGYADSLANLQRSLLDQYGGMNQAKGTFNTDLDRQLASTKDENTAASQAARAEAILRRAAEFGL